MTYLKTPQYSILLLLTASPVTRIFFQDAIKKLDDYTLICEKSSPGAFDSLHHSQITFIVIDEKTPSIDLAETCIKVRSLKNYKHIPILIITSCLKKSFIKRLLQAGASDFLCEPLEENAFFHRMEMTQKMTKTQEKLNTFSSQFSSNNKKAILMKERIVLDDQTIKLIAKALEEKTLLAMLLLGIDQYEQINQVKGTKVMEALLIDFQDHLHALIRGQDLFFSQKKGNFLILLPKTSSRAAQFIAENIQESLEMTKFHAGKLSFHLTASIGLVTLDQEEPKNKSASFHFSRLMKEAVKCLNAAKKKGNTIVAYETKKGSLS